MPKISGVVSVESVASKILDLRDQRVIIDADLASLYGVKTRILNQAVKRNIDRFPEDFMFQLTKIEKEEVITNCDHLSQLKFSSYLPYAYTEHGAIMAANILNSDKAERYCHVDNRNPKPYGSKAPKQKTDRIHYRRRQKRQGEVICR
jgi:hypothetical protein